MDARWAVAEDERVVICVEDRSNSESKRHNFQGTRPNGESARARVLGCKRYIKGGKGWTETSVRGQASVRDVQNQGRISEKQDEEGEGENGDGR
jgi:hypothetical protein